MKTIHIFTTGGTIDKIYFDAKSKYEVGPPNIERVLAEMTLAFDYHVTSLMRKDSLEITEEDRFFIADEISKCPESEIVVTHGTDTMVETAKVLAGINNKTIVLTGALEPALFKTSDALFNIGCALAAVQTASAGVYITMNGAVFPYDHVWKNVDKNRFEFLE